MRGAASRRPSLAPRVARARSRLYDLRLSPRVAALVGGGAGALMGLVIALSMERRAAFTGPHQGLTAGAALVALWLCIGVVAGLTVLAPDDDEAGGANPDRPGADREVRQEEGPSPPEPAHQTSRETRPPAPAGP